MAERNPRVLQEDWLGAGLEILRTEGHNALRIDILCKRLGKTKGSFYHHFKDREAFVEALLDYWQFVDAETLKAMPLEGDNAEAYRALVAAVGDFDHALDLSLRAWGHENARVKEILAQMDEVRIQFNEALLRPLLPDGIDPRFAAEVSYTSFIGAQQMGVVKTTQEGVLEWNQKYLKLIHAKQVL